jgi:hypothetical protein
MAPTSSRAAATSAEALWLRRLGITTFFLLAVQFLAGMLANLFVTVPARHPGRDAPEYFSGVAKGVWWALGNASGFLQLHVLIGLLLGIASIVFLVLAIRARQRGWIVTAIFGFIGVFAAGFNGASFMNYGHDFSSLLMSLGFLVALLSYSIGLYVMR